MARENFTGIFLALAALGLTVGGGLAAGQSHRIVIKAASYDPAQVRVHIGDQIEWDNQDIVAHTATVANKAWEVVMGPGRSGRIVAQSPGRFDYICRYHPNMKGEIIVEP
ncbi:cupredoxin domain-containing protein [Microvirga solisilvae]|uniref:cupredoxin domain-containing protein n=1 Tax=Microvirga solisilvae TaxID=2919498 RepID=UPI001FAF9EDE|nr:cupredoxin domain-containing protein [Microvirga solisilvae]